MNSNTKKIIEIDGINWAGKTAISTKLHETLKDFDISPGQEPSLRAEAQIKSTREGVEESCQRICASSMLFFVASHSVDNSYDELA